MMASAAWLCATACASASAAGATDESFAGRNLIVYVPARLPDTGQRAMVVVLHGGLGNAQRIESKRSEIALNMDEIAEKNGFIVAYLNGTPVTRFMGDDKLGWNAGGGCCGLSAENDVDDVRYITGAIDHLVAQFGIDRNKIYGLGHSNGAMMTQRVMCETGVYAAEVSIAGPLNLPSGTCSAAKGKRILAIHGADDENVPVAGGRGTKGMSKAVYNSEARSRDQFTNAGATYTLDVVKGADHPLADIDAAVQRAEGVSLQEKTARFFGLLGAGPLTN
jgi:polyhydroxybutyrate depolymerase